MFKNFQIFLKLKITISLFMLVPIQNRLRAAYVNFKKLANLMLK